MSEHEYAAKLQVEQADMIRRIEAEMERLRPLLPDLAALELRRAAAESLDATAIEGKSADCAELRRMWDVKAQE